MINKNVHQPRISRYIQPQGPRVLVRVIKEENIHPSGLYLPEGAKEKMHEAFYGEVIEVARAHEQDPTEKTSLGTNVSGIPCGARVLFPKAEGIRIPWDESLRILDVKHILATVEEVPLDEAH